MLIMFLLSWPLIPQNCWEVLPNQFYDLTEVFELGRRKMAAWNKG